MSVFLPSSAGSVVMPGSSYAGSHYGGGYHQPPIYPYMGSPLSQHYYPSPMMYGGGMPMMMPTAQYGYPGGYGGYGGYGTMPYFGGSAPMMVVHGHGGRRHRRHHHRFLDF